MSAGRSPDNRTDFERQAPEHGGRTHGTVARVGDPRAVERDQHRDRQVTIEHVEEQHADTQSTVRADLCEWCRACGAAADLGGERLCVDCAGRWVLGLDAPRRTDADIRGQDRPTLAPAGARVTSGCDKVGPGALGDPGIPPYATTRVPLSEKCIKKKG